MNVHLDREPAECVGVQTGAELAAYTPFELAGERRAVARNVSGEETERRLLLEPSQDVGVALGRVQCADDRGTRDQPTHNRPSVQLHQKKRNRLMRPVGAFAFANEDASEQLFAEDVLADAVLVYRQCGWTVVIDLDRRHAYELSAA